MKGEQRTKTVCIRNIRFFSGTKLLADNSPDIFNATSVSITFEWQKRDIRDDTITHQKSDDSIGDKIMCPVRAAAKLVSYLYRIPHFKVPDLQINTVIRNGQLYSIPSTMILDRICSAIKSLGKDKLGSIEDEVGTHSNRSGGVMGMFLAGTPVYTKMLLGHWSSDAFMYYIRKQVLSMSHGVSSKIIQFEEFYTVPDFVHNAVDGDLRKRNKNNIASLISFSGSHTNMRRGIHPTFH